MFLNLTFIFEDKNMAKFRQLEAKEEVRIDDFEDVYNSTGIKIIWFLSWIIFETVSNATYIVFIMFEKYGG